MRQKNPGISVSGNQEALGSKADHNKTRGPVTVTICVRFGPGRAPAAPVAAPAPVAPAELGLVLDARRRLRPHRLYRTHSQRASARSALFFTRAQLVTAIGELLLPLSAGLALATPPFVGTLQPSASRGLRLAQGLGLPRSQQQQASFGPDARKRSLPPKLRPPSSGLLCPPAVGALPLPAQRLVCTCARCAPLPATIRCPTRSAPSPGAAGATSRAAGEAAVRFTFASQMPAVSFGIVAVLRLPGLRSLKDS
ncbi:hypothetical protein AURDEDRAFT_168182 [Auricularia subglabra TFB-10046 SS5]|nr:hypothetical protein AURDEDRAFT_168182 [Auricularia subglabra TFB-10046 SS5]